VSGIYQRFHANHVAESPRSLYRFSHFFSSECGRAIVWNCASGAVEAALPLDTQGGGAMDADAAGGGSGGGGDDGSGMLVGCSGP
jgi:hypothetical protein